MKKKKKLTLSSYALKIILIVVGSVLSTLVLLLSAFVLRDLMNGDLATASRELFGVFILLGISRFVTFITDRNKITFVRFLTLLLLDIGIGVLALFAKDNPYFYSLCSALYCLTVVISRIFKMFRKKTIRGYIFNGLVSLIFALLAIGLFVPSTEDMYAEIVILICILISISALLEVLSNAMSRLKLKLLFKIIMRTYALEIILGLVTIMVACSLVFMLFEPNMTTFTDALWYSFAIVTTIGFGDIVAITAVGRILSVIIGLYGIIVVAVITSIIVNFYNETAGKKDHEGLKEIKKEEDE